MCQTDDYVSDAISAVRDAMKKNPALQCMERFVWRDGNMAEIEQVCTNESLVDVNQHFSDTNLTLLHLAVIIENTDLVTALVSTCDWIFPEDESGIVSQNGGRWMQCVNVNACDSDGCTPLHFAVRLRKNPAICSVLLQCRGIAIDQADKSGNTALHYACATVTPATAKVIALSSDANGSGINAIDPNTGENELPMTCERSEFRCAHLLLKRGASMAVKNRKGWTPLMIAANLTNAVSEGAERKDAINVQREELYRDLMENDMFSKTWNDTDEERRTAMHIALAARNRDFVLVAIESFEALILGGDITQDQLKTSMLSLDFEERQTCLHLAAMTLDAEVLKSVLNLFPHNDDGDITCINYTNGKRLTPLQEIVSQWRQAGVLDFSLHDKCMEISRILISRGATLSGIEVGKIIRWEAMEEFLIEQRKRFEQKRQGILLQAPETPPPMINRTRTRSRGGDSPSDSLRSPSNHLLSPEVQQQHQVDRRLSSRLSMNLRSIRKSLSDMRIKRSESRGSFSDLTNDTEGTPTRNQALDDMIRREGQQRPGRLQKLVSISAKLGGESPK